MMLKYVNKTDLRLALKPALTHILVILEPLCCIVVAVNVGGKEVIPRANPQTTNKEELASSW